MPRLNPDREYNREYMRKYRQTEPGRLVVKAAHVADRLAASYLRTNLPEVWAQIMAQARTEVGLPPSGGAGRPRKK